MLGTTPAACACRVLSSSGGPVCSVPSRQAVAARASCSRGTRRMRHVPAPAAATEAPVADAAASVTYPTEAARKALYSVGREQVTEQPLEVTGTLPPWLSGQLLVNGGGDYSASKHMFDGFAFISKLRVQGGKAWGAQRYVKTKSYTAYKATGKIQYREFAAAMQADTLLEKVQQVSERFGGVTPVSPLTHLCVTSMDEFDRASMDEFDRLRTIAMNVVSNLAALASGNPDFTDNASVNLHQVGPGGTQLLATSETPTASYLINPDTLDTLQQAQYSDGVKGDLTTAHPAIMPDGSMVNFTRTLPFGGFNLFRQDPVTLQRTKIGYVPDRRPLTPSWVHDFAATDKYAIIPEWPLYMNLAGLVLDAPCEYVFMNWKPEDGTLVHLVTLDGSQPVRSFQCPTFFAFHFGNAFESADGSMLHVDVAAYDDPTILNDLSLPPLVSPAPGHQVSKSSYRRLSIPLTPSSSSSSGPQQLLAPQRLVVDGSPHQEFSEFPAVNPAYAGKQYRYCWCLCAVRPTNMGNAIAKIDTQQGSAITWHRPGGAPGEPRFVARPGATAEDDGVLVVPCMGADGRSFVAVLDAKDLKEVATVQLPFPVPNRFHGIWLNN